MSTAGRKGRWLGSLVVGAMDLLLDDQSQVRFPAATASTGMGDRLWTDKPIRYFTKPPRPTQPPTLRGTEMSTGQSVVMLCGWRVAEVKAGWLIPCG